MPASFSESRKATNSARVILHEPTLHFFVIAGIIFVLYTLAQSKSGKVLEISQQEIDARIFQQEMNIGEELNAEQRQLLASTYIEEQILVREALAMNLDNDTRIHSMLAQKMRHVLSGEVIQPSDQELQDYFQTNATRYQSVSTVTADALVFYNDDELAADVVRSLNSGAGPQLLLTLAEGDSSSLPNVNHFDIANIFEPEFADRVFAAIPNQWIGPFISNRGQHWVRVTEKSDARLPALAEIADRVRLDWISEEEQSRLQQEIDNLWDSYSVVIRNE